MGSGKISVWGDLLRFSPLYFWVCVAFAVLFFAQWYRTYRITGWKIDYWNFNILLYVFIPFIFFYPVSASILQITAVGKVWFNILDDKVETALTISLFGFVSMLLGRLAFDRIGQYKASALVGSLFGRLEDATYRNIMSGSAALLIWVLVVPLAGVVLSLASGGNLAAIRTYFLENGSFRSLYNLLGSTYPLLPVYYWLRHQKEMSFWRWVALFLMIGGTMVLGARSALAGVVINLYLFRTLARRGAISFSSAVPLFFALAIVSIVLGALRDGNDTVSAILLFWHQIFYGSSLSDLRDFAWALGAWDGHYWYGKTYLAGLLGFIPRALSDFREQWTFGVIMAELVGFSREEHAGIRPGIFGESYLNFGLPGVFVIAWINGFLLRYADFQIKRRISEGRGVASAYTAHIPYAISSAFFITSGFWTVYVFLVLQLLATLLRKTLRAREPDTAHPTHA